MWTIGILLFVARADDDASTLESAGVCRVAAYLAMDTGVHVRRLRPSSGHGGCIAAMDSSFDRNGCSCPLSSMVKKPEL